jgi:hypothetical protein
MGIMIIPQIKDTPLFSEIIALIEKILSTE